MMWLLYLAGIVLMCVVVIYVFPIIKVYGNSMHPTYKEGEILIGFRFYPKSRLKVGDVVLYKHEDKVVIKRIAGITPAKSQLYCLGDNSPDSYDSRHYGFIPLRSVMCRPFSQREKVFLHEE